ncbi:MAG: 50S ribosomal protein L20 [Deltaproteobacteria bacterium]|jgi:large subunit ribosomal protein L20|nr:50S ribosomal protein L20 [Deltaproteobacteria bacterium]
MRVKGGLAAKKRHKKILKMAKGFRAGRRTLYRSAREGVERGLCFAYRDRKVRKREMRALWIIRVGAAARSLGLSYSRLMDLLKKSQVELDRRALSELATREPENFASLVKSLQNQAAA